MTRFTVLERFGDYSLVELQLETGRTHQIRVHMAYIGHPVAGDPLYGPRKTLSGYGQFLHAKTLGLTHPMTGKEMIFTVEAPEIFQKVLKLLRKNKQRGVAIIFSLISLCKVFNIIKNTKSIYDKPGNMRSLLCYWDMQHIC